MEEMRLMLVDDEKRFLVTTKKLLARKGINVVTAGSGMEALEKLRCHAVHVVVLDVCMPAMGGIALLREIKRQYPTVEVLMLTGHATVEATMDGLKSGAADFLIKPVDIDDLLIKAQEAFIKGQALNNKIRSTPLGQPGRRVPEKNPSKTRPLTTDMPRARPQAPLTREKSHD